MAKKYLIVTSSNFIVAIRPIIKQKQSRGYNVIIKHVEDFGALSDPNTTDNMRNYILGENPEYLLLVGDYDQTPSYRVNGNYDSDNYFVMEDNDIFPKAKVGRLSTNDVTVLKNICRSLMDYPADPGENWKRKVILSGFCPRATNTGDAGWSSVGEIGNYFDLSLEFDNGSTTTPEMRRVWETQDNTLTTLIDEINSGATIVSYFGHGNWNGWGNIGNNEYFRNTDIGRLNVGNRLPFVISAACITGDIQRNSFAETWQIQQKAVGVFAADVTSDTWWNERIVPRIFHEIVTNQKRRIGDVILNAMKKLHEDFPNKGNIDGISKKHSHIYRYLGDPDTILTVPEDNGINECKEIFMSIQKDIHGQYVCSPHSIDLGKNVRRAWATISGFDGIGALPFLDIVVKAKPEGTKVKIKVNFKVNPYPHPPTIPGPTLPGTKGKIKVTVFALL